MTSPSPAPPSRRKRALSLAARILFVGLVVGFALWSFRDDWPAVGRSMAATPWWVLVSAIALTALGVIASLPMWLVVAHSFGYAIPFGLATRILFVAQLGKYIPGSVWTVAVQAQLMRARSVPVRTSSAVGLIYIGVHLASALAIGSVISLIVGTPWNVPWWAWAIIAFGCAASLTPPALNWIGRMVAGPGSAPRFRWAGSLIVIPAMIVVWSAWCGASALLAGPAGLTPRGALIIAAAFLLAYCAGLVVVIAPAGFGVREAVLIAMTAPLLGTTSALTLALLSRLVSAAADFGIAGAAWVFAPREPVDRER